MFARLSAFGLAAAALISSEATAADLYSAPPTDPAVYSPAPVFSWTGLYFGVHGGGGWGDSESTFLSGVDSPADFNVDGPYVGAQIGYNWQINSFVLGVEADASWSGIDGFRYAPGPDITTTHEINWFATVRGRVGYAFGNVMPYVTGGWAYADVDRFSSSIPQTVSSDYSGWTVGGGVEWAFAQNWTLKGEYKYIDFGSANSNFSANPVSVDMDVHTFELGLNYKF